MVTSIQGECIIVMSVGGECPSLRWLAHTGDSFLDQTSWSSSLYIINLSNLDTLEMMNYSARGFSVRNVKRWCFTGNWYWKCRKAIIADASCLAPIPNQWLQYFLRHWPGTSLPIKSSAFTLTLYMTCPWLGSRTFDARDSQGASIFRSVTEQWELTYFSQYRFLLNFLLNYCTV